MTLWSLRRLQASNDDILSVGVSFTGTTGGEIYLVFIFWLLLILLI
jgi:hypothetical protein